MPSRCITPRRVRSRNITLGSTCAALASVVALVTGIIVGTPTSGGAMPATVEGASVSAFSDTASPASSPPDAQGVATARSWRDRVTSTRSTASTAGAVFDDETAPTTAVDPDPRPVELGVRFIPKADSTVTAIRFFKTSANVGPHIGSLWSAEGELLARVSFPDATADGWQTAALDTPITVTGGREYVAAYLAPRGLYSSDEWYFRGGIEATGLSLPAGAGVYTYTPGAFPQDGYRSSNYYVDVQLDQAPALEPTPAPTPTTEPTSGPTPVPTEPAPKPSGDGFVFVPGTDPGADADPDRASVELGMRFSPKVDGLVTAVRFYRTDANAGPHRGALWSADGDQLARVDFATTATGWNTAQLSEPVEVMAGATYVVSYLAERGRYVADEEYFAVGIETEYLTVPTGAGVYAYGAGSFPRENYRNSNYYVDIRFSPAASNTPTPTSTPMPTPTLTVEPTPTPSTPRPTPTAAPTATEQPRPNGPDTLNLPTEPWWGGADYYKQFEKADAAGWDEDTFFPISVFFGKPSHADELAAIGINTYMGAEHDGSPISAMTSAGISVLAQGEWSSAEVGDDPRVVGWHVSDECDMGLGGCDSPDGERGSLAIQQRYVDEFRAKDDGRFLQANFGNGVLGSYWSLTTMDDHLALVDTSSVDKYAYTSPHVQDLFRGSPYWPEGEDPASASAYGWQQDRMESFMSPVASKPNWIFVETARPYLTEPGSRTIALEQISGAAWNGIIHGSAGIAYFQHNNDGSCGNYSLIECSQELRSAVATLNAEITGMAAVINSPSYVWDFGVGLSSALKVHDGYAYIIAMTDGGSGERQFTLPPGMRGSVEVIGEDRYLDATLGTFTDSFDRESSHHIYRISLD